MTLKITYQGTDTIVPDGGTAVIGADPEATVRVTRPGISRRHLVVSMDGSTWILEDAASKNGTYHDGTRVQRLEITAATTVRLGHPTEGEPVTLTPIDRKATRVLEPSGGDAATVAPSPAPAPKAAAAAPASTGSRPASRRPAATDPRLDDLVATLADTVKAVRGLTFSVWAMIAVTAVLAILTLFVGILGR